MALFFKLPHPGGPAYDPAVVGYQKKYPPPYKPPPTPTPTWSTYPQGGTVTAAAYHGGDHRTPGEEMREVIPELFDYTTSCPMSLKGDCDITINSINLYRLIQHLNDEHKWSREEIADWLDSLEVDLTWECVT